MVLPQPPSAQAAAARGRRAGRLWPGAPASRGLPSGADCWQRGAGAGGDKAFYNRSVALPLGLSDVGRRLRSGYYRQPQALLHDIRTIRDNAATFNAEGSSIIEVAEGERTGTSRPSTATAIQQAI